MSHRLESSQSPPEAPADAAAPPLLSLIVPTFNEAACIERTLGELACALEAAAIPFEIWVVDDNSADGTLELAQRLAERRPQIHTLSRPRFGGFGRAIRAGLEAVRGDVVVIAMGDGSDDPGDVVRYYRKILDGYDCVFGSRFRAGSRVEGYPPLKLVVNRIVNRAIQCLFWTRFNDLTNAFKAYRRSVLLECGPYTASHFNITLELALGALIRRYQIAEIPIHWYGRGAGFSKLSLGAMGRRYLSVVLKLFCERLLVSDDILEERLARGRWLAARFSALESRVSELEGRWGSTPPARPRSAELGAQPWAAAEREGQA